MRRSAARTARRRGPEADLYSLPVPGRSGRDHRSRDHPAAARRAMKRGDREVLIVVDIQNDFCPGGALAVPEGDAIVPAVNRLAREFAHVILTQDWHPRGHGSFASARPGRQPFDTIEVFYGEQILWPDHCVQGKPGAAFHPGLDVPHAELVLRKGYRSAIDSYSAFRENDRSTPTGLASYLKEHGFEHITLCGL